MNPFDLSGPPFLLFYTALAAVALLVAALLRRRAEAGPPPTLDFGDPYHVAFLRGGAEEALRVAVVALIDRGLLQVDGRNLSIAGGGAPGLGSRPLEHAVLQHFGMPREPTSILTDPAALGVCRDYERHLEQLRLLPDANVTAARRRRFLAVGAVLVGVTAVKLVVAFARGRHNVGFLLIGTGAAVFAAYKLAHPSCTERGMTLLRDLRTLFADLRQRRDSIAAGAGDELALLAGIYGLAELPHAIRSHVEQLYPKAKKDSNVSGCGSACGSSCGSGCGGGGGGCGGCGG